MRQFDYSYLADRTWDNEIMSYISKIHEYKGKQELFLRQRPVELNRLIEIAKIQSTEASNRIEGIITTNARLKQLVADKTTPKNRDEEEILGYRNVLNLVHENYEVLPIRSSYILQMHRDLLKYTNYSYGGQFKTTPNEIDMVLENGEKVVLFKPLEPYETAPAIEEICTKYQEALDKELVDELILIPCFLLDFLCIHPFNDGNGRMSRLLTLLLLYQSDYIVGKYISIEKIIEESKETYYEALQDSSLNWHENENDYKPFVNYMLGVIVSAYKEFESRVKLVTNPNLSKSDRIREIIKNHIGTITKSELLEMNPDISDTTVQRTLAELLKNNEIKKIGGGRYTKYTWNVED